MNFEVAETDRVDLVWVSKQRLATIGKLAATVREDSNSEPLKRLLDELVALWCAPHTDCNHRFTESFREKLAVPIHCKCALCGGWVVIHEREEFANR